MSFISRATELGLTLAALFTIEAAVPFDSLNPSVALAGFLVWDCVYTLHVYTQTHTPLVFP